VFYLLNLALHLELYGDFTRPRAAGLELSPWDLLDLLGRRLLRRDQRDDPVWPVLAELAGRRRGEQPGRGFRPPLAWRTPPAWLEPVACDGPWRWSAVAGVLRIVHPAGFPAVAVPRTAAAPAAQVRQELRPLTSARPVRTALPRESTLPLTRWVGRLGGYAEVRLARALGLADAGALPATLLVHRARILLSPTHVDVELSLGTLPLAIRFAGLDRTPGWIPAAGRYVAFHFV
jgi:hypothetical protein